MEPKATISATAREDAPPVPNEGWQFVATAAFRPTADGAASALAHVGDSLRLRRQPRFCPNETEEKEYLKILTERMRVEDDDMDSDTAEYIKNLTEQMRVADAARDDCDIASYERMQRRLAACGALPPPTHRVRKRKHRSICTNTTQTQHN